jgi:hypothetical protein
MLKKLFFLTFRLHLLCFFYCQSVDEGWYFTVCNVGERIGNVHGRRSGLNGVTLRQIK